MADPKQFHEYQSFKKVAAGRIQAVNRHDEAPHGIKSLHVTSKDDTTIVVTPEPGIFAPRYTPEVGDYYVVYDDGYASISPRAKFEAGYRRIGLDSEFERLVPRGAHAESVIEEAVDKD